MKFDFQKIADGLLFGLGGGIGYAIFELIATKF
jgi:hypothetical protein